MAGLRKRLGYAVVALLAAGAIGLAFRQELIPQRLSPLPRIDIAYAPGWLVDWQLASLRNDPASCRQVLESPLIQATPIRDDTIRDGCGITNGVRVSRIDGVSFPIGRVRCEVAVALALWIKHDVQPAARVLTGQKVTAIRNMGSYACRNIRSTNPLLKGFRSQHSKGSAIDIGGFRLSNGRWVSVARHWKGSSPESRFLKEIHRRACRYFRVVLGPEYNIYHRDHFHLDRGPFWRCK